MKTVTQYKEDIKNLMKKTVDIDAKCIAENRESNTAELCLKNEILDTVQEYKEIIETMERQERMQASLEEPANAPSTQLKEKSPAISGIEVRNKDKFNSFGQQMTSIMRAGCPGGVVDPRLFNAASGLNETVPSDGGFLVQQDFSTELLKQLWETGLLAAKCKRIQISGNANSIKINGLDETSRVAGSRAGGMRGYWAAEADEKTASKPKFRKIELSLNKLIGLCYATDELLDDSSALEGIIRQGFNSEFGFLLDDAIFSGSGAGQPLGIMNSGCLVSVAKETGQTAKTIVAENIMNMRSRLFANSRGNSIWLINQNIEPQLHKMSIAVGTGGVPVYMPAGGLSGLPYDTLYGRPVIPIEQCMTLGTAGDIVLADFTNGYVLGEKGGIKSDISIHVRFIYDESVFRFVMRVDGQTVLANAITPYKGGSDYTQSHFISLATRA